MEMSSMTTTTTASKNELKGLFDVRQLKDPIYKVTITPVTKAEAEDIEFKSLKGIAGKPLSLDDVRKERLGV